MCVRARDWQLPDWFDSNCLPEFKLVDLSVHRQGPGCACFKGLSTQLAQPNLPRFGNLGCRNRDRYPSPPSLRPGQEGPHCEAGAAPRPQRPSAQGRPGRQRLLDLAACGQPDAATHTAAQTWIPGITVCSAQLSMHWWRPPPQWSPMAPHGWPWCNPGRWGHARRVPHVGPASE